ncbi:flotillin-1 [Plakobranchus ocellatus]|uniref:Flotillin-1 n=1 Tax=Plakobranchus ocellatus TaxID=259542 RepID=A0AAV3YHK8_9GAST|nr:flotillin-1 [Plakobranchus ocellatus]
MGFETCGPNEVMVISGCCYARPRYVNGGCVFVWPKIQRIQRLPLAVITVNVESLDVRTRQGVVISMKGVAQIQVCADIIEILQMASENFLGRTEEEIGYVVQQTLQGHQRAMISSMSAEIQVCADIIEMLQMASENFLGRTEEEIGYVVQQTLEGHQRAIISSMSAEEIYVDRQKFSRAFYEEPVSDLINMGIRLVSYTISDIWDGEGFLKKIGQKRAQEMKNRREAGETLSLKKS